MVSDGRGLSLDILPSGKMSWLYRYCLDGKYGKVSLGHYPDLPLRTARERRDELTGKVAKGESSAMERKLARAGMATNPTVIARLCREREEIFSHYASARSGEHNYFSGPL